jgi:molybdopterin-guanine dinucleotide biosynthesis protein A
MGRDKASLPFGPEPLLDRILRRVGQVTSEIVLAAAQEQAVPPGYRVCRDPGPDEGPLPALLHALDAVQAELVFVVACDTPLLQPALLVLLAELCPAWDGAVPVIGDRRQATCAVYRTSALREARARFGDPRHRSLQAFLELLSIREVPPEALRGADPALLTFTPCNTPEEYAAALRLAGIAVNDRPPAAV